MRHEIRSTIGAVLVVLAMCGVSGEAGDDRVVLTVECKLTDLEYKPLPSAPVRLVFGSTPDWRR
jgi:hypothetical protein